MYAGWDVLFEGYDVTYRNQDYYKPYIEGYSIPYFRDELLEFNNFMNRKEGHTILFTDNCPKPVYITQQGVSDPEFKIGPTRKQIFWDPDDLNNPYNTYSKPWSLPYPPYSEPNKKKSAYYHNTIYINGPLKSQEMHKDNKVECEKWLENKLVWGCAKPFKFDGKKVEKCDYI